MVTDGILGAVHIIINELDTPEKKAVAEVISDMLSDFDEDEWLTLSRSNEEVKWIKRYLDKYELFKKYYEKQMKGE